jgi:hypothetical protein
MPSQPFGTNGLGFRHLIEDGLAILNERPISADRRDYVVRDLSQLVLQAKRGSELVRSNALSVATDDRNAFDSYSILDRYWDRSHEEQWNQVLAKAGEAFDQLQKGATANLSSDQRNAAANLLEKVLSGLIREPKPGVPSLPEELRIGS